MRRTMKAVAYFGIAKATVNNEKPLVTVSEQPFSGPAFDSYIWYRASVELPISPDVIALCEKDGSLEEITEHPNESG